MTTETRSLYSQLPAIDRLLRDSSFLSLRDTYGHTRVVELLRQMLDEAREVIRGSQTLPAWCENWAQEVDARLTKEAQSALRPVINLTGKPCCIPTLGELYRRKPRWKPLRRLCVRQ